MEKQLRVIVALSLFAAAAPLPAAAQMRVEIGAVSRAAVPVALPAGAAVIPSASLLAPAPMSLNAALAAPVNSPAAIAAVIPAVAAPALAPSAAAAQGDYSAADDEFPAASLPAPSASAVLRDAVWSKRIEPSAYAAAALPRSRSRVKALFLRTFLHMGRTFEEDSDALPASRGGYKIFHPFGSVLKVRYDAVPGHPFTGLFADRGVPGLMRLSLALPPASAAFIPGVAFKLFVDGHASANAVFLNENGLDGQQPDRNFFARAFTSVLPKPHGLAARIGAFVVGLFNRFNALRIPVDAFAERRADGTAVEAPLAPYRLVLKPAAGRAGASNSARDFRDDLGTLTPGPLFEVYAQGLPDSPLVRVGDIHAESAPVASEYGDTGLFFRHRRVAR